MAERWLVLSNCQTEGLANCLQVASRDIVVDQAWVFDESHKDIDLEQYDRVCVHRDNIAVTDEYVGRAARVIAIPGIQFAAYHPDLTIFVDVTEAPFRIVHSPLADYSSMLAVAAHRAGLRERDALRLFRGDVYERLGYMNLWSSEKDRLARVFAECQLALVDFLPKWSAGDPFMYSINHPKIRCLKDLALTFLRRAGVPFEDDGFLPADNLANAPVFPIYPEIAESCFVTGGYLFKPAHTNVRLSLEEFIAGTYKLLDAYEGRTIVAAGGFEARFQEVVDGI